MKTPLSIDEINALCADIAEVTITEKTQEYCDTLDAAWLVSAQSQYPQYFDEFSKNG